MGIKSSISHIFDGIKESICQAFEEWQSDREECKKARESASKWLDEWGEVGEKEILDEIFGRRDRIYDVLVEFNSRVDEEKNDEGEKEILYELYLKADRISGIINEFIDELFFTVDEEEIKEELNSRIEEKRAINVLLSRGYDIAKDVNNKKSNEQHKRTWESASKWLDEWGEVGEKEMLDEIASRMDEKRIIDELLSRVHEEEIIDRLYPYSEEEEEED